MQLKMVECNDSLLISTNPQDFQLFKFKELFSYIFNAKVKFVQSDTEKVDVIK